MDARVIVAIFGGRGAATGLVGILGCGRMDGNSMRRAAYDLKIGIAGGALSLRVRLEGAEGSVCCSARLFFWLLFLSLQKK